MQLKGRIALVTGASRGIGRGIAIELGKAGSTVYITGRRSKGHPEAQGITALEDTKNEIIKHGGEGIAVYCDHSNTDEVKKLFEMIERDHHGRLDILVNNVFSAAEVLLKNTDKKFWELDPLIWDDINNVGLRNHYICSVYAARLMVPRKSGLIVNISSAGGLAYAFSVAFGVGKAALDRMAIDCALELKEHKVAVVSLWPGLVRTEFVQKVATNPEISQELHQIIERIGDKSESPEYAGKCVVHLASDIHLMQKSGHVFISRDLGDYYGFTDVEGKKPGNLRSVKILLQLFGWKNTANWVPEFVKVPCWILNLAGSKL